MKQKVAEFLFKRIEKKLDDVREEAADPQVEIHIDDIEEYLQYLKEFMELGL